jgi:hypothetical protein
MSGRLRGWWGLPGSERWTLLLILVWLPLISSSLRAVGYVRTRRWIEKLSSVKSPRAATDNDLQSSERLAQLAAIAGRRGAVTATCLRQSLLVYGWLRHRGFAPELMLGVRKQEGAFDAHAWVELEGRALGQSEIVHAPLRQVDRLNPT